MRLYGQDGTRLYINEIERKRFVAAANASSRRVRTLCLTLAYTGCRLSEALALTGNSFGLDQSTVTVRTLKKRDRHMFREIPIPPALCEMIECDRYRAPTEQLWPMCRATAWRQVKAVMAQADIFGKQATPKGLRHGFGVHGCFRGVQLHMLQKWMGHANISTTAIYANAIGPEEYAIAARMWDDPPTIQTATDCDDKPSVG